MLASGHPLPRRRRAAALWAGALYLLGAVAVPLVHAQTEDLAAAATVEAAHTLQCDRIHSDSSCPASGAFRALAGPASPDIRMPALVVLAPRAAPTEVSPPQTRLPTRFVRGPPA